MKKAFTIIILTLSLVAVNAQTNLQEMYDFNRGHLTTTIEFFHPDKLGNTFSFTDIYHPTAVAAPSEFYTEISRALNFWQNTKLALLSLHIEWNGGIYANNAWLFGVEYFLHSSDFNNTLTLQLLYKNISNNDNIPLQFTAVWGLKNIFGVSGLSFLGYLDIWGQRINWTNPSLYNERTSWVWLAEPQIWYNVGRHFGCDNLSIGGEVELAYNFAGSYHPNIYGLNYKNKGFNFAPCLGAKWVF